MNNDINNNQSNIVSRDDAHGRHDNMGGTELKGNMKDDFRTAILPDGITSDKINTPEILKNTTDIDDNNNHNNNHHHHQNKDSNNKSKNIDGHGTIENKNDGLVIPASISNQSNDKNNLPPQPHNEESNKKRFSFFQSFSMRDVPTSSVPKEQIIRREKSGPTLSPPPPPRPPVPSTLPPTTPKHVVSMLDKDVASTKKVPHSVSFNLPVAAEDQPLATSFDGPTVTPDTRPTKSEPLISDPSMVSKQSPTTSRVQSTSKLLPLKFTFSQCDLSSDNKDERSSTSPMTSPSNAPPPMTSPSNIPPTNIEPTLTLMKPASVSTLVNNNNVNNNNNNNNNENNNDEMKREILLQSKDDPICLLGWKVRFHRRT